MAELTKNVLNILLPKNISLPIKMLRAFQSFISTDRHSDIMTKNREVITRLKFIGSIQTGQKIDAKNLSIEPTTIFTPIKRAIFGESRNTTLEFLTTTVDRTFEIIQSYLSSDKTSDKIFCSNVINDLIKAINGLKSMQKTYTEDKLFHCEIETLIESIQAKVFEIQETKPDLLILKSTTVLSIRNEKEREHKDIVHEQKGTSLIDSDNDSDDDTKKSSF